jgi:hypothetical protein
MSKTLSVKPIIKIKCRFSPDTKETCVRAIFLAKTRPIIAFSSVLGYISPELVKTRNLHLNFLKIYA